MRGLPAASFPIRSGIAIFFRMSSDVSSNSRSITIFLLVFGTSNPIDDFPGKGATTLTLGAFSAIARSSERLTTFPTFVPGANSNSYMADRPSFNFHDFCVHVKLYEGVFQYVGTLRNLIPIIRMLVNCWLFQEINWRQVIIVFFLFDSFSIDSRIFIFQTLFTIKLFLNLFKGTQRYRLPILRFSGYIRRNRISVIIGRNS